jgi:hypothetical protein
VITERTVVGVLHYTHYLNCIITQVTNSVDDIFPELFVAMNSWLNSAHANMTFIDFQALVRPFGILVLKLVLVLNIYAIVTRVSILLGEINPCRYSIFIAAIS